MKRTISLALGALVWLLGSAEAATYTVANNSQFQSALKKVVAGDQIVLQDGTGYQNFTLARDGTADNPIVIRAANKLKATISGLSSVILQGDYITLAGLDFVNGSRVVIEGTGDRVTSSRIAVTSKSIAIENQARLAVVDHNEIKSLATGESNGWMGVRADLAGASDQGHKIYRNYFHGAPKLTTGDDNSAIQLGYGGSRENMARVLVEYNLFEDWDGDDETISAKTSGHTIQFNTVVRSQQFVNRMGHDNAWIANYFENSGGLRIHDRDNKVVGNVGRVRVMAGDIPSMLTGGLSDGYVQPDSTLVSGNTGLLELGGTAKPEKYTYSAKDTRIEQHTGEIKLFNHVGTVHATTACKCALPEAVKLTTDQVGPFAPTAPVF